MKESKTFFNEVIRPNVEGIEYSDVTGWTVPIDVDVHQGFEKAGWWEDLLQEEIENAVERNRGQPIPKEELFDIANKLLDEVEGFHGGKPIPR